MLTPEKAVEIQEALGADIAMVLDECIRRGMRNARFVRMSYERSIQWAAWLGASCQPDQLACSASFKAVYSTIAFVERMFDATVAWPFAGLPSAASASVRAKARLLCECGSRKALGTPPEDRPRYLMGVGRPQDILQAVRAGFDMFDCVIPTRNARNGTLFTWQGKINIKRAEFARDARPIDETADVIAAGTGAYLRHLYMAGEILSAQLNSLHNLYFYHRLMDKCREAIRVGQPELWPQLAEPDGNAQAQTIPEDS